jgi:hypothetical protein
MPPAQLPQLLLLLVLLLPLQQLLLHRCCKPGDAALLASLPHLLSAVRCPVVAFLQKLAALVLRCCCWGRLLVLPQQQWHRWLLALMCFAGT